MIGKVTGVIYELKLRIESEMNQYLVYYADGFITQLYIFRDESVGKTKDLLHVCFTCVVWYQKELF